MATYTVGYFVGSLAKGSINRKLAKALVRLAPAELVLTEIPFRDLPLYCYDFDADFPPAARDLKSALAAVDAVLFVTPEYNRSIPGGLKNAIDWASRPYGQNSFSRKPSAIIGTSPGKIGTAIAQAHLRSIMAFCNSPLMNSIEAYIQFEKDLITDDGEITNESTATFLRGFHGRIPGVRRSRPEGVAEGACPITQAEVFGRHPCSSRQCARPSCVVNQVAASLTLSCVSSCPMGSSR